MQIDKIINKHFSHHRNPRVGCAEYLDVAPSTIYRWINDPKSLPVYARLFFKYIDRYGLIQK